jgi:hypothetical protein
LTVGDGHGDDEGDGSQFDVDGRGHGPGQGHESLIWREAVEASVNAPVHGYRSRTTFLTHVSMYSRSVRPVRGSGRHGHGRGQGE